MIIDRLQSLREQEYYDLFWEKMVKQTISIGVKGPQLPQWHNAMMRAWHAWHSKSTLLAIVLQGSWQHNQLFEGSVQSTWLLQSGGALDQGQYERILQWAIPFFLWLLLKRVQPQSSRSTSPYLWCQLPIWYDIQWQINTTYHIWYQRSLKALSVTQKSLLSQVGEVLQIV